MCRIRHSTVRARVLPVAARRYALPEQRRHDNVPPSINNRTPAARRFVLKCAARHAECCWRYADMRARHGNNKTPYAAAAAACAAKARAPQQKRCGKMSMAVRARANAVAVGTAGTRYARTLVYGSVAGAVGQAIVIRSILQVLMLSNVQYIILRLK